MKGMLQDFRVKSAKKCIGNGGMDCICVNSSNRSGLSYACTRRIVQASKTFAIRLRRDFYPWSMCADKCCCVHS